MKIYRKLKKFVKNRGNRKLLVAKTIRTTLQKERKTEKEAQAIIEKHAKNAIIKITEGDAKTIEQQADIFNERINDIRADFESRVEQIRQQYADMKATDAVMIHEKENKLNRAIDSYRQVKEDWQAKHEKLLKLQNYTISQMGFMSSWIDRIAVVIGEHKDWLHRMEKIKKETYHEGLTRSLPE